MLDKLKTVLVYAILIHNCQTCYRSIIFELDKY